MEYGAKPQSSTEGDCQNFVFKICLYFACHHHAKFLFLCCIRLIFLMCPITCLCSKIKHFADFIKTLNRISDAVLQCYVSFPYGRSIHLKKKTLRIWFLYRIFAILLNFVFKSWQCLKYGIVETNKQTIQQKSDTYIIKIQNCVYHLASVVLISFGHLKRNIFEMPELAFGWRKISGSIQQANVQCNLITMSLDLFCYN